MSAASDSRDSIPLHRRGPPKSSRAFAPPGSDAPSLAGLRELARARPRQARTPCVEEMPQKFSGDQGSGAAERRAMVRRAGGGAWLLEGGWAAGTARQGSVALEREIRSALLGGPSRREHMQSATSRRAGRRKRDGRRRLICRCPSETVRAADRVRDNHRGGSASACQRCLFVFALARWVRLRSPRKLVGASWLLLL